MFELFHRNADNPVHGFVQQHGDRYLIHNPPLSTLSTSELDEISDIDYERDAHPYYKTGEIRALETIKQSITTHRGCFGQCNFCSICVHQGQTVVSRSHESIITEALRIKKKKGFNGIIYDVGGPTANMYDTTCLKGWTCKSKHCLIPRPCGNLKFGHQSQMRLLQKLRSIPGVKKVFITSGIRPDLVMADGKVAEFYIKQLVNHHISGQIKLAPEHSEPDILALMNKPGLNSLLQFKSLFDGQCKQSDHHYFMTYYLIAAHPGCTLNHMRRLQEFLYSQLKSYPEQIQIFTPSPTTISTCMFYCESDMAGNQLFCEKNKTGMQKQKNILKSLGKARS